MSDGHEYFASTQTNREHVSYRECKDTLLTHEIWIFPVRLLESRKKVAACLPLIGHLLLDFSGTTLLYTFSGKHGHRCAWYKTTCTQPAAYRILQEQLIKIRDLPNLARVSAYTSMGF